MNREWLDLHLDIVKMTLHVYLSATKHGTFLSCPWAMEDMLAAELSEHGHCTACGQRVR